MKLKLVCIILMSVILLFIFGNSVLDSDTSAMISDKVADVIDAIFGDGIADSLDDETEDLVVRKIAHFVEFASLGAVAFVLVLSVIKNIRIRIVVLALGGLCVSLFDETIQIFSGRGSMIKDVWLDFAGYAFGVVCVAAIFWIFFRCREKKSAK